MPSKNRLFVYDKSLDAMTSCELIARALPPYRADLADQLRRASSSIVLNIAEGSEEFSPREKMRIYRIARRSAAESLSVLDIIDRAVIGPPSTSEARNLLDEVMALLTNTSIGVEKRLR